MAAQPGIGEDVVVVAGDDDHGAALEALADRAQRRRRAVDDLAEGGLAQLERVTEQDQAIDALERREQGLAHALAREHVDPCTRSEVQVGDDQRARH